MTKVVPKQPTKDGFPGTLNDEQVKALKAFWKKIDGVVNPQGSGGRGGHRTSKGTREDGDGDINAGADEEKSGKNAFKGVSKDDNEKERQRKAKEAAATKKLLAQLSPQEFRHMVWISCQADNPDALILRFLRARNFDVEEAFSMLCASLQWRKSSDVPGLIRTGEAGLGGWKDGLAGKGQDEKEGQRFLKQYETGKSFAYGTTLDGCPVAYIRVDLHYFWHQKPLSLQRFVTHIVESGRMTLVAPAEQVLVIFDMSKFGLSNMDYLVILFLLQFFSTYYPEALSNILVFKAPWVFQPIWRFLKPLIDQAIREKILFVNDTQELLKYVDVTHLPDSLGGEAVVDWHYPGPQGPAKTGSEKKKLEDEMDDLNRQYEEATRNWIDSTDQTLGKEREVLALRRFVHWRKLDPYLRAKTVFQAQNVVSEYGIVKWTYKQKDGSEIVEEMGKSNKEILDEIRALESGQAGSDETPGGKSKKSRKKAGAGQDSHGTDGVYGDSRGEKDEIVDEKSPSREPSSGHDKDKPNSQVSRNMHVANAPSTEKVENDPPERALRPGRIIKDTQKQVQDVYGALTTGIDRAHQQVELNGTS